MTTSFRRTWPAIRRTSQPLINGEAQAPLEAAPVGILAGIQPASAGDYQAMEAREEGRRKTALYRVYSDALLRVAGDGDDAGDIIIYNDKRLLIVGKADRHILGSSVSHYRYWAAEEIEKANGESPA